MRRNGGQCTCSTSNVLMEGCTSKVKVEWIFDTLCWSHHHLMSLETYAKMINYISKQRMQNISYSPPDVA